MRFHAFHGVMESERLIGGTYLVSFKIGYDFTEAAQTDDIQKAIDYGVIYDMVKEEMKNPSCLIEHVAKRIQDRVVFHFPCIQELETMVSKLRPPFEGEMDSASVVLHFHR